jgi:hypothetical protein
LAPQIVRNYKTSIKHIRVWVAKTPEAGFSVGEKVQTQSELSSVSGNPFPSGNELLVFQSKLRNRLGGTEDWK